MPSRTRALKINFPERGFYHISTDVHINHSVILAPCGERNRSAGVRFSSWLESKRFLGVGQAASHHPAVGHRAARHRRFRASTKVTWERFIPRVVACISGYGPVGAELRTRCPRLPGGKAPCKNQHRWGEEGECTMLEIRQTDAGGKAWRLRALGSQQPAWAKSGAGPRIEEIECTQRLW